MSDRIFTLAFGTSLGLHLLVLLGQVLPFRWLTPSPDRAPLQVIYEYEIAKQELRTIQEQFAKAAMERGGPSVPATLSDRPQIRIPSRPSLLKEPLPDSLRLSPSSVVDLTNLADAARGNPVLLTYFSAIREQIQQTANRRSWWTAESAQGIVYISFLLTSSGTVKEAQIVGERSAPSPALREIALRIVKGAAPFPPFPPSMTEPTKTIVVPLEFLLGP